MRFLQGSVAKLSFVATSLFLPVIAWSQPSQIDTVSLDELNLAQAEAELAAAEAALLADLKGQHKLDTQRQIANDKFIVKETQERLKTTIDSNLAPIKPTTKLETKIVKKAPNVPTINKDHENKIKSLERQLTAKQKSLSELSKRLRRTRDQLMVAETEIERLSLIIDSNNKNQLKNVLPNNKTVKTTLQVPTPKISKMSKKKLPARLVPARKVTSDMPVITVIVNKANLRTGPGTNNSPLMTVAKGTRLAVEKRVGEWFRIITPTGSRAWISSDVVRFGKNLRSSPTRTVKIRGYTSQEEDEAFEFIKQNKS